MWKKTKQKSAVKQSRMTTQSGQALMEFVLGIMIVISFFMFYIRMAAIFAVGNYIHYATFMSARAYMSSTDSQGTQQSNAEAVLRKMVSGRWKTLIKPDANSSGSFPGAFVGSGTYAQDSMAQDYWNQGATYSYQAKLSIYPWNKEGNGIDLKLTSESWMPREPSEAETIQTKGKVLGSLAAAGMANVTVEWDNGY